jgi:hypothetical protein
VASPNTEMKDRSTTQPPKTKFAKPHPQVLDPLASIALLQEKDLPSPPYLAAVLLHAITALQAAHAAHAAALDTAEAAAYAASSYLGRRRQQQQQQLQQLQQRRREEGRVDPRIVGLAVRLWLSQGRLDLLVHFLRCQEVGCGALALGKGLCCVVNGMAEGGRGRLLNPQPPPLIHYTKPQHARQGALDSDALALFLLNNVPAAHPTSSSSSPSPSPSPSPCPPHNAPAPRPSHHEEEGEEAAREFRRLLRDMLWRLHRLDLLVLQLLRVRTTHHHTASQSC